ncbi:MAG: hypothetical protein V2G44_08605 [bacterium JZ-2024 1]
MKHKSPGAFVHYVPVRLSLVLVPRGILSEGHATGELVHPFLFNWLRAQKAVLAPDSCPPRQALFVFLSSPL